MCSSSVELREIYTAIAPRNKALRKHQKCNIPTLIRISREPYQMGLLKTGEQPMMALKIMECRVLTDEERIVMKAEAEAEMKKEKEPVVKNRCDAETSLVLTQPHDTGETTSACLSTAPLLCPVDRVAELFPRPLYCA